MVRLLVEEACDALPLPNPTQRRRNDRFLISTSTAGAHPAQRVRSAAQSCCTAKRLMSGVEASLATSRKQTLPRYILEGAVTP
ncbi:MAG: hypothetical protein E5W70_31960 [Mesorhizobium sp.]|nr:MAG: hypothetical protein E5W70_31960 [Mesorhizobium sp.]